MKLILVNDSDAAALLLRNPAAAEIEAHLQDETFPCSLACVGYGVHFVDVSPVRAFTANPFT